MRTMSGDLVMKYFRLGLSNNEILDCLTVLHGQVLSIRSLKRMTKKLGLFRRKNHSDVLDVALLIVSECENPGQTYGYRWIHAKCIEHGFVVTQDTVRLLMHIIDPEGIDIRKRRRLKRRTYINPGPNAVWHIDGYDKLARYGIYIHGCVDGYSRCIIWLHAYYTNKDPKVTAGYFVNAVSKNEMCPRRVRFDRGTENGHIEQIQNFLRRDHADQFAADRSAVYGTSVTNQRIEWMWGLIRRQGIQYWINFMQKLTEEDNFVGDFLDKNLARFCFMDMIQNSLDEIKKSWNNHRIRAYRNCLLTSGRPWLLHSAPSIGGTQDYGVCVNREDIDACAGEVHHKTNMPCDSIIFELCNVCIEEHRLSIPSNPDDMYELYRFLRTTVRAAI